jgi:hypothetical protein
VNRATERKPLDMSTNDNEANQWTPGGRRWQDRRQEDRGFCRKTRPGQAAEMSNRPHVPTRLERLAMAKAAPRCEARSRSGNPCKGPAMANGRCRFHGGMSTGPRTPEGLERSRKANWKHGLRSAETIAARREAAAACRLLRRLVAAL